MTKRYISIDPGGTTGIIGGEINGRDDFTIDYSVPVPWDERHSWFHTLFEKYAPFDFIIIETFRVFKGFERTFINQTLYAPLAIGSIEQLAFERGCAKAIRMLAPSVKNNMTVLPQHLKVKGIHITNHTTDAYKLARYFILMNFPIIPG